MGGARYVVPYPCLGERRRLQQVAAEEARLHAAQDDLYLECPNAEPGFVGKYSKVAGKTAQGQPVWKREGEDIWLCIGTDNRWHFSNPADCAEVGEGKSFRATSGLVSCVDMHNGEPPDKMIGDWCQHIEEQKGGHIVNESIVYSK